VEFHAARLLLLLLLCGKDGRIDGLTKMAKLDFFVRYPQFFERACAELQVPVQISADLAVESTMIRYHYGPWDERYYHILAYLRSRALVRVEIAGKAYELVLTDLGQLMAKKIAAEPSYSQLVEYMGLVRERLGSKNGTQLKNLVYKLFDKEIAQLPRGEVIR
jgi:hypothetical protein